MTNRDFKVKIFQKKKMHKLTKSLKNILFFIVFMYVRAKKNEQRFASYIHSASLFLKPV